MPDYRQYCGLARTLDVVGDRWTLLIVRELMPGPRRFTDLVEGLPGISRKVLTERLRDLERDGIIVRQELPAPAARHVYSLTEDGRDLSEAAVPLIGWGARRLGERAPGETFRARWAALGMATFADRSATVGVRETYQYFVGDSTFHFVADDGSIELRDGLAENAAVTITTDEETLAAIMSGTTSASEAARSGAMTVEGDRAAAKRLGRIFARERVFEVAEASVAGARTHS